MAQVHVKMHYLVGFAVVDRARRALQQTENRAIGWLLASLLGQVVAQKWDGTLLYDVQDSGKPFGPGVRARSPIWSSRFIPMADGYGCPRLPLVCSVSSRHRRRTGRLVSLCTVHNELRRCHPDLLARLYRPFWWDRQAEHAPDDVCVSRHPVYQYDGHTLMARYYDDYMCHGARLAGEALDTAGTAALAAMRAILDAQNWGGIPCRAGTAPVHQQPSVRPRPHRLWRDLRRAVTASHAAALEPQ